MDATRSLMIAMTIVLAACGERQVSTSDAGGADAAKPTDGRRPAKDGSLPIADARARPDAAPCNCKPGEVWHHGPCTPTLKLGCGPSCDPTAPSTSCAKGYTCHPSGALPCCTCSSVRPACVLTANTGPIVGPLRISPTSGGAGQKVTLAIAGAPFYVGALFYKIRMGQEVVTEELLSRPCSVGASFTPKAPGLYPVEVSQYGGRGPWVLAGFFHASGGLPPTPYIQPGFPCRTKPAPGDPRCAQATPYTCACLAGRCRCK